MSLFQNSVSFGTNSWKNRSKPGFSPKSKEAVPKTEVLEQPHMSNYKMTGKTTEDTASGGVSQRFYCNQVLLPYSP
jgi:hypothetical protein